jgi:hypothetical protein
MFPKAITASVAVQETTVVLFSGKDTLFKQL